MKNINNHPDWIEEHDMKNEFIENSEEYKSYAHYLRGDHWQRLSRNMLARHAYCQCCGIWQKHLIVHHQTYARIGNENLDDLAVLCLGCHLQAHQQSPSDMKLMESESVDDFSQD